MAWRCSAQAMKHSRSRDSSVETARGTVVSEGRKRVGRGNNTTFWAVRLSVLCLNSFVFVPFFSLFFLLIFFLLQLALFFFWFCSWPLLCCLISRFFHAFRFWFGSSQFGSVQLSVSIGIESCDVVIVTRIAVFFPPPVLPLLKCGRLGNRH